MLTKADEGGRGVMQLLTIADEGGGGGPKPPKLADIICGQPLILSMLRHMTIVALVSLFLA